jgi:hypothetical protein
LSITRDSGADALRTMSPSDCAIGIWNISRRVSASRCHRSWRRCCRPDRGSRAGCRQTAATRMGRIAPSLRSSARDTLEPFLPVPRRIYPLAGTVASTAPFADTIPHAFKPPADVNVLLQKEANRSIEDAAHHIDST